MKREIEFIKKFIDKLKPYLLLLPALSIIFIFSIYPTIKVLLMAFYTKYNYFKHIVFERGTDNFVNLFKDELFLLALKNTATIVLWVVPISIIISIFISTLLYENTRIKNFIRGIYFIPFITSTVAVAVVFRWIFNSKFGLLNFFLSLFGIDAIEWLLDPKYSIYATIIFCIWKTLGYNILIFVTGLRKIDDVYLKAAKIDGANGSQRFRKIILPLLSPTVLFISITSLIGTFKVFQEVYTLFGRSPGPLNSSLTIVYYIYDNLMNKFSYGIAAAASLVLFAIILVLTLVQFIVSKKYVHYN